MRTFVERLDEVQTRWDAAVLLLQRWNERPPAHEPARLDRHADDFSELVDSVRAHFERTPGDLALTAVDRSMIASWTGAGQGWDAVDAVGHGLSLAASAGFTACWRNRAAAEGRAEHERLLLRDGDIVPVPDVPWPETLHGSRRTPGPRAIGIHLDDHPGARVHRCDHYEVVMDFRFWGPLTDIAHGLIEDDGLVGMVLPNEDLSEFHIEPIDGAVFPVAPVDRHRQSTIVLDQVRRALDRKARITVLPELSTSAEMAHEIATLLDGDPDHRLVVCGSWHTRVDGQPANIAHGRLAGYDEPMEHRKLTQVASPFAHDREDRVVEGIEAASPPTLTVHVAGPYRWCILICRDFLDPEITETLKRVGANVILVPAMSKMTHSFKSRALEHVTASQATTVCVNGPLCWPNATPVPSAFLARPYERGDVVAAPAVEAPELVVVAFAQGAVETSDT